MPDELDDDFLLLLLRLLAVRCSSPSRAPPGITRWCLARPTLVPTVIYYFRDEIIGCVRGRYYQEDIFFQ